MFFYTCGYHWEYMHSLHHPRIVILNMLETNELERQQHLFSLKKIRKEGEPRTVWDCIDPRFWGPVVHAIILEDLKRTSRLVAVRVDPEGMVEFDTLNSTYRATFTTNGNRSTFLEDAILLGIEVTHTTP